MSILHVEPTRIAQWRTLVIEGQEKSGFQLNEGMESYVVMTLDAYTTEINLSSAVLAIDFLKNVHVTSTLAMHALREVGDQCLILSGLFPQRVLRKNVSEHYFIQLGKNAYHVLSYASIAKQLDHSLFFQLFESFSELTQVLKAMRLGNNTMPTH
ncbi:MAG: hypothetical protein COY58_01050 [Gammaproteobacteria bacterium CG_4_10_14_0_8_um_filter_38_16]|nr:MAG: hypothetical protein COY58_01050 [Gammaproteobacteria bacterium CG_4_10_14_0_8_um_filter_38_16]PJA03233.1 MAG: hypothetical protein COX72_06050 [Gammaproteobacteria bacterium CG_4_10_14_0_2_um_filter_38_22]PJB10895.1 MAG: hypothetical protein CO120_02455 [Gammaproteobacteria bacterium CG_4_9_14_3_um_filter_38_9]